MSYMTKHCFPKEMYTKSQNLANFGLTYVPEKGRGFVTVRAVTAKDVRDFKE